MFKLRKKTWLQLQEKDRLEQIKNFLGVKGFSTDAFLINMIWINLRETLSQQIAIAKVLHRANTNYIPTILTLFKPRHVFALIVEDTPSEHTQELKIEHPVVAYNKTAKYWTKVEAGKTVFVSSLIIRLDTPEQIAIDSPAYWRGNKIEYAIWKAFQRVKFEWIDSSPYVLKEKTLRIGKEKRSNIYLYKESHLLERQEVHRLDTKTFNYDLFDFMLVDDEFDSNKIFTSDADLTLFFQRLMDTGAIWYNEVETAKEEIFDKTLETYNILYNQYYNQKFKAKGLEQLEAIATSLKICSLLGVMIQYHVQGVHAFNVDRQNEWTLAFKTKNKDGVDFYIDFFNFMSQTLFKEEVKLMKQVLGLSNIKKMLQYIITQILTGRYEGRHQLTTRILHHGNYIVLSYADQCGFFRKLIRKTTAASDILTALDQKKSNKVIIDLPSYVLIFYRPLTLKYDYDNKVIFDRTRANFEGKKQGMVAKPKRHKQKTVATTIPKATLLDLLNVMNLDLGKRRFFSDEAMIIGMLQEKMKEDIDRADKPKQTIVDEYLVYACNFIKTKIIEWFHLIREEVPDLHNIDTLDKARAKLWSVMIAAINGKKVTPDRVEEFILDAAKQTRLADITHESIEYQEIIETAKREARLNMYLSMTPEEKLESNIDNMTYEEKNKFLDQKIEELKEYHVME